MESFALLENTPGFCRYVAAAVAGSGVDSVCVGACVTESDVQGALQDMQHTAAKLTQNRDAGHGAMKAPPFHRLHYRMSLCQDCT